MIYFAVDKDVSSPQYSSFSAHPLFFKIFIEMVGEVQQARHNIPLAFVRLHCNEELITDSWRILIILSQASGEQFKCRKINATVQLIGLCRKSEKMGIAWRALLHLRCGEAFKHCGAQPTAHSRVGLSRSSVPFSSNPVPSALVLTIKSSPHGVEKS